MLAPIFSNVSKAIVGGSIRGVVCGLRRDKYARYSVAVLKAFVDDSGSGGDCPWYVLAGYIGTIEGWDSFDGRWAEVLHQHPRIEYFKSSEAESLRPEGQWAGISKKQRDAKLDALIEVIGCCARRAVNVRMRQKDYDDLVKGNIPHFWDKPYYFLQTLLIGAAINIERLDGESDSIDFVFDREEKHETGSRRMLPAVMLMQSLHGSLVNVTYQNEQDFPPLQAADLVAWQIRRFFSVTEPRRKQYYSSQHSLPKEPHSFIVGRARIKHIISEIRERAERLATSLGCSPDVRTWR